MKEKIFFSEQKYMKKVLKEKDKNRRFIFNFINSHDLYHFGIDSSFREAIYFESTNFIDGFVISMYLSLKNLKKVKRFSGPNFTRNIFYGKSFVKNKKHFFIGFEENDIKKFSEKFSYLKKKDLFYYNPPYIKKTKFSEKEIGKIAKQINSKKIDFVWVGLGCPKQYFLSESLFKKTKARYFFNVGAAMDFLLNKKKRAPEIIRNLGIEWLYRLLTNFNHSKKKVKRSLVSIAYLPKYVELK